MELSSQIEQLIQKLTEFKPIISENSLKNYQDFNDILQSSIVNSEASINVSSANNQNSKTTPDWVNKDYSYSENSQRKPNTRELIEAIHKKPLSDLKSDPNLNLKDISQEASYLLYGVVGSNADERNWDQIMSSEDILRSAREMTALMYGTHVDIESHFSSNNKLEEQYAVVKDKHDNVLCSLKGSREQIEKQLFNFGLDKEKIPVDLETRVKMDNFDYEKLSIIRNFIDQRSSLENDDKSARSDT